MNLELLQDDKEGADGFDSVITKHSVEISGMDGIALTKLDVLDSFKEVKICVGYKVNGKKNRLFSKF